MEELDEVARRELRETPALREQSVEALRQWLQHHPHIRGCRTDAPFLLRFLRTCKFSLPLAQHQITNYLIARQRHPQWFTQLDVDDPELQEILDNGYVVPLPERDDLGRKVILSCAGRFDPYRFTSRQMARCHSLVVEALMDDPESQVRGYAYVNDESGLNMGHVSLWSLHDVRSMLACIQKATPMRHKATHFLNVPPCAAKVFQFFIGLLSEKLRARVMLHSSVEDLRRHVNPKILPREYGGEVPLASMIADFKEELRAKKEVIRALDDMTIDLQGAQQQASDQDQDDLLAGSFRKLEVD